MKSLSSKLPYISIFLLHFIISFASTDKVTSTPIHHEYTIQNSLTIDLEDLLNLTLPAKITSDSSSCEAQPPSLFQTGNFLLSGSFLHGEKVFQYKGMYYVLQIDPENALMHLFSYKSSPEDILPDGSIPQKKTNTSPVGASIGSEIFDIQFKSDIGIFSTLEDLLIWDFGAKGGPELIGEFSVHKHPIQDFVLVENIMYVAGGNAIVAYNIQGIANADIRTMNTFSSFTLPDKQVTNITSVQGICECQDVLFFAEGNRIFVVKQDMNMFAGETMQVERVISTGDDIIQIERVGRSLIILTSKEVIEYVFGKDCLNYNENIKIPNFVFEFDSFMTFEEAKSYLSLKGNDEGRYFAVVNQLRNSVYIFEVAMIPDPKKPLQPFYVHKAEKNIDSLELYEDEIDGATGLILALKQNSEKAGIVSLQRLPLGLKCSSWRSKSEIVNVQAESRFCQNIMYNYTEIMEGEKYKDSSNETLYQDPKDPCQRSLELSLNYEWTSAAIFVACIAVLLAMAVIIIVRLVKKKKEEKYQGHTRFYNERSSPTNDRSVNRIEISSLSIHETNEENKEEDDNSPNVRRRKKVTKKTVRTPEN